MNNHNIVVIGASAGGIEALKLLIKNLPASLEASVFIVLHIPPYSKNNLAQILDIHTQLDVVKAENNLIVEKGKVYVAIGNYHMILENDRIFLGTGPKENRFRPSVDVLFRSAAYSYGARVIGILLSGAGDDGSSGFWTINRFGGTTILQDPSEAIFPQMVINAREYTDVDYELSASEIGTKIVELTKTPAPETRELTEYEMDQLEMEVLISKKDSALEIGILTMGEFSSMTCPECHGSMIQLSEGRLIRYRCHTGHAFTVDSLLAGITKNVEESMWQAMRGMQENILLLNNISEHFEKMHEKYPDKSFAEKAAVFKDRSKKIYSNILKHEKLSAEMKGMHTLEI